MSLPTYTAPQQRQPGDPHLISDLTAAYGQIAALTTFVQGLFVGGELDRNLIPFPTAEEQAALDARYVLAGGGTNAAPTATVQAITGTTTVGQTLTGHYTYADAEGNPEGASPTQFYRADDTSGLNRVAIAGATGLAYTLVSADQGKYIQFGVTPVSSAGTTTGTQVLSGYSAAIVAAPASGLTTLATDPDPTSPSFNDDHLGRRNGNELYVTTGNYGYGRGYFRLQAAANSDWIVEQSFPTTANSGAIIMDAGLVTPTQNNALFSLYLINSKVTDALPSGGGSQSPVVPAGSKGRLRGGMDIDNVHKVFGEYSTDGTTWLLIRADPSNGAVFTLKAYLDDPAKIVAGVQYSGLTAVA